MSRRPRFTNHATEQLEEREISREEVAAVIDAPLRVTIGATAVEYDGVVGNCELHIVVVRGSDPPLVITLWENNR